MAALVGVMFTVVLGTFGWGSFRLLGRIPLADALIGILVALAMVAVALPAAVIVGVVASALVFAWDHAKQITVRTYTDDQGRKGYELHGTLLFTSVKNFGELFEVATGPEEVIVEFRHARVTDHSGIEAVDALTERYVRACKHLPLRHLSPRMWRPAAQGPPPGRAQRAGRPALSRVADDRLG